jgi:hypothetical protein
MKFVKYFLFLWAILALLDPYPNPGTPLNPDTDPDPQHWFKLHSFEVLISITSLPNLYTTTFCRVVSS